MIQEVRGSVVANVDSLFIVAPIVCVSCLFGLCFNALLSVLSSFAIILNFLVSCDC